MFVTCKLLCCKSCSFCRSVAAKERRKSRHCLTSRNEICERCFLCRSLEFCHKCPNCCSRSTCRGQFASVVGKMGSPGDPSQKVITVLKEGNTLPFQIQPNLIKSSTIISCYPHRNFYQIKALHALMTKNAVEQVTTQKSVEQVTTQNSDFFWFKNPEVSRTGHNSDFFWFKNPTTSGDLS